MKSERQLKLVEALQQILQTLKAQYQPDKVILFGSMANANVGDWSDIDLVIVKDTPRPFCERSKQVALLCAATVGVDFFVYTPGELAQMVAEKNSFIINEVIRKGQVLYEREPASTVA